jgi:hypothetical protein
VADQEREVSTVTLDDGRDTGPRDAKPDRGKKDDTIKEVRATDIEPYTGLGYLSKLFRFLAVILVMLLIAEVITGFYTQGMAAIPTLLGEASRLIVLAGVLWGSGDLAHLLIDIGHDVRAARILASRAVHSAKFAGAGHIVGSRARSDERVTDRPVTRGDVSVSRSDSNKGSPPIP